MPEYKSKIQLIVEMLDQTGRAASTIATNQERLEKGLKKTRGVGRDVSGRIIGYNEEQTAAMQMASQEAVRTLDVTDVAMREHGRRAMQVTDKIKRFEGISSETAQTLEDVGFTVQRVTDETGNLVAANVRVDRSMRHTTRTFERFKMHYLSIMFFGMALQRTFMGMAQGALKMTGVFDLFNLAMTFLFLPVALEILPLIISFIKWILNLSDATKKWLGRIFISLGIIGALVMALAMLGLAWQGVKVFLDDLMPVVDDVLDEFAGFELGIGSFGRAIVMVGGFIALFTGVIKTVNGAMESGGENVKDMGMSLFGFTKGIDGAIDGILNFIEGLIGVKALHLYGIPQLIDLFIPGTRAKSEFKSSWEILFDYINDVFINRTKGIGEAISELTYGFTKTWLEIVAIFLGIEDELAYGTASRMALIEMIFNQIKLKVQEIILDIGRSFALMFAPSEKAIEEWGGIYDEEAGRFISTTEKSAGELRDAWIEQTKGIDSIIGIIGRIISTIANNLTGGWWNKEIRPAIDKMWAKLNEWYESVAEGDIVGTVEDMVDTILTLLLGEWWTDKIKPALISLTSYMGSYLDEYRKTGFVGVMVKFFTDVLNFINDNYQFIGDTIESVVRKITKWGEIGVHIATEMMKGIKQYLIDNAGDVIKNAIKEGILGTAPGLYIALKVGGFLEGLQYGGIVTRPTPALIGERGPEAVIPLERVSPVGGVGGVGTVNVYMTNNITSPMDLEMVKRDLISTLRREIV